MRINKLNKLHLLPTKMNLIPLKNKIIPKRTLQVKMTINMMFHISQEQQIKLLKTSF